VDRVRHGVPESHTRWVHSSVLDLFAGCGAWSLPLLLLPYLPATDVPVGITVFYALALIFNYPHYFATIYRAYHTRGDFNRYGFYTKTLTAFLLLAWIAAETSPRVLAFLFTLYVTWSPWHYTGQNFGILMLFVRRNGVEIGVKDRNALWTAFTAAYLMTFLSLHTNPSTDPYVWSLGLPGLLDILRIPLAFVFLICGVRPLAKLIRKSGWRPMTAPLVLFSTQLMWFVLPTIVELVTGVHTSATRYSSGVLAVMHSAQYLWITSYFARRESEADRKTSWKPARYFGVILFGGIALFIPAPWMASWVLDRDFTTSVLTVTALINIHHFILDGAVWKLRENRIGSLLLERGGREISKMQVWKVPKWAGSGRLKWACAGVLLILAAVDQTRYFLTAPGQSSSKLAMAARLNPNDAPLLARLGQASAQTRDYAAAEQWLEQAIRQNPNYPTAHFYLGNLDEFHGNVSAALSHYDHCVRAATFVTFPVIGRVCELRAEGLVGADATSR
jgi:hypothetical protein